MLSEVPEAIARVPKPVKGWVVFGRKMPKVNSVILYRMINQRLPKYIK
jgi:hypothetical protein